MCDQNWIAWSCERLDFIWLRLSYIKIFCSYHCNPFLFLFKKRFTFSSRNIANSKEESKRNKAIEVKPKPTILDRPLVWRDRKSLCHCLCWEAWTFCQKHSFNLCWGIVMSFKITMQWVLFICQFVKFTNWWAQKVWIIWIVIESEFDQFPWMQFFFVNINFHIEPLREHL